MNVGAKIMLTGTRRLPAGAQAPTCYVRMPDGWSANRKLARNGLGGDQARAEFSSHALFPSRPLDTNPGFYLQRGRSFGTKELWPEWPERNAGLRVRG
jgi:hypothetical protein